MGPRTEAFEREFAEHLGVEHVLALSSGTAALHLACIAAGVGAGDEVIVPSQTFVATVNAVLYTGVTPVFADIAGPRDLNIDVDAVEAAIGERRQDGPHGARPRAEEFAERHIALPFFPSLSGDQVELVVSELRAALS